MLNPSQAIHALDTIWVDSFERAKVQPYRTLRQFAEQEIVIPKGPFKGRRFSCHRQPYAGLWFDLVDSGKWNRFFATGPVQSGKTLVAFIIPTVHKLFELEENVVMGIPDGNMIADKWLDDILPVIQETRYARFLPSTGATSRGGDKVMGIRFKNGVVLRFMTAGGSDKSRAGFTAPAVVATEVDGFDGKSETSKEGDKFSQLEDRTMSFGARRQTFGECTVSLKSGRTWREYENGTRTRIIRPCPHCGAWVTPEREHLVGWRDAPDVYAAAEKAALHCPDCGEAWSEEERESANLQSRAIHRGQELTPDGKIVGEPAKTDTLSFRWTAVDNHFVTMADVAKLEWLAVYGADSKTPDEAETTLRQKTWVIPPEQDGDDSEILDEHEIMRRTGGTLKGIVPAWATRLTAGVDVGKRLIHFLVIAWGQYATSRIISYGVREVPSDDIKIERAIELALRDLAEDLSEGFPDEDGEMMPVDMSFVDSGWKPEAVYVAVKRINEHLQKKWKEGGMNTDRIVWWASKGFGESAEGKESFRKPKAVGSNVLKIGDGSFLASVTHEGVNYPLWNCDADHWKSWADDRYEHMKLAKHLTAERSERHFKAGKGYVTKWVTLTRNNHLNDARWNACAAGHWVGVRLTDENAEPARRPSKGKAPDSRLNRWSGIRGRR
jgi:hypothetical protein